jgi:hypothetical protein
MSHFNMNRDQELFQEGCAAYVAFLKGEELTQEKRTLAKCFLCMCGYAGERQLCEESSSCPSYHSQYPLVPRGKTKKVADMLKKVLRLLVTEEGVH